MQTIARFHFFFSSPTRSIVDKKSNQYNICLYITGVSLYLDVPFVGYCCQSPISRLKSYSSPSSPRPKVLPMGRSGRGWFPRKKVILVVKEVINYNGIFLHRSRKGPGRKIRVNEKCTICNARATGFHYNVLSCEGCKVR